MTYVSDGETVEAAIRADRTAPSKARGEETLAVLAAKADQDFEGIAGYSDLTDGRRQQLFKDLLEAKRHFDSREMIKAIPKDSAAIALLAKVAKSIRRAAEFGDIALETSEVVCGPSRPATPQGNKAFRLLEEAGEQWARQHCEVGGELPSGFPQPWKAAPGLTHYGAASFIEAFLRNARVMESIILMAQSPGPKPGLGGTQVNFQNGPMEWLAGKKLPAIYSRIFQLDFTVTVETDTSDTSNGIKFVRAACLALGLHRLEDETIKTHYRNARS